MPQASDTAMVNAATRRSRPGVTKLGKVTGLCAISSDDRAAREQQPGGRAERRQHAAFGDQLPHQPAAAGAERGAHGDLAAARFRARDQQVGDVGAGDEQDERDRRHQRQQRRAQRAEQLDVERADLDAALLVGLRVRAFELPRDAVELGSARSRASRPA